MTGLHKESSKRFGTCNRVFFQWALWYAKCPTSLDTMDLKQDCHYLQYVSVFVLCYLWRSTFLLTPTVLCAWIYPYISCSMCNDRGCPPLSIGIGHGIYGYTDLAQYGLEKMCYVKNNVAQKH